MELSLSELKEFAKQFVKELPQTLGSRAHLVGLKGELGAGKTTFVQEVARELGIAESVTSPTFVIAKSYQLTHPVFRKLVHVDAYRLSLGDPDTIGFGGYLREPTNLMLVEWPEHLQSFPGDAALMTFHVTGEDTRAITHA